MDAFPADAKYTPENRPPRPPLPPAVPGVASETPGAETEFLRPTPEESESVTAFPLPASWRHLLRAGALLAVALFGCFCAVETASFLRSMAELPWPTRVCLSVPMVLFTGIIVYYLCKILRLGMVLGRTPEIELKVLRELENRRELRHLCLVRHQEAKRRLEEFLGDEKARACDLRPMAGSAALLEALASGRERLQANQSSARDWIADFTEYIQKPLDRFADQRIRHYAVRAGVLGAVCPYPLIDRLVILSASLSLMKELMLIYRLKPSWDKGLALAARAVVSTYLAGVVDDAGDSLCGYVAENADLSAAGEFAGKLAGKAAAGGVQGLLVSRLGHAAVKMLRPVVVE